jgi:hypothetical protein
VATPFVRRWSTLGRRLPAAALLLLALAALAKAAKLPFGTIGAPDSGFYPSLVCVALAVFAALSFAESDAPRSSEDGPEGTLEARATLRVWTVIAALAGYGLLLVTAGFPVCTAALLLLLLRMGRVSWAASTALAVVATAACYALFTRLGVPLPPGMLSF